MENQLAALRGQYLCDETALIRSALDAQGGSLRGAAARLGCPVASLVRALERHPQLSKSVRTRAQYCTQLRTEMGNAVRVSKQPEPTAKPKTRRDRKCTR